MIIQALPSVLLIATGFLFIQSLVSYYQDSKRLRRFPSPSFAAISSLWRIYHNLRYRHYRAVHEAHQKYGTHVRIAPNHISVLDVNAMNDIYGHGAGLLKEGFYDGLAGEVRSMVDTRDKEEHQARRKLLAHVFAQKSIASFEPIVAKTIRALMGRIEDHVDTHEPINLRRYLNFFAIDVFSTLMFDECWGCLDRGDDVVFAETPGGNVYRTPYIRTVHDPVLLGTALGMAPGLLPWTKRLLSWHPYAKTGKQFDDIIAYATRKRLANNTDPNDLMSKLLANNKGEPTGLSEGEIRAEASVMMNAGTDTTTAALTYTIFLLYKHTDILARLREEVDAATKTTTTTTTTNKAEIISYDTASKLPFLRACIEESLRLRPPSSFGLPRIVPKGGRMIAGQFIAEDVTVSVPTYSMLRNPAAFDHSDEYIPDRWITGDKAKMAKAHFPFSTGPRACIGRNIAYYEQLMVVANLVREFEFEFVQGSGFELRTIERFNSNPDEMVLRCYRRAMAPS